MPDLILGPLLRHVDTTMATIWVETSARCTVRVTAGDADGEAHTFTAGGHHYALVTVTGLHPGTSTEYQVYAGDQRVWPQPAPSSWPASRIRTRPDHDGTPLTLVFGSCRAADPGPGRQRRLLGPDALDAYTHRMIATAPDRWPDALLLLGDQVYADETSTRAQKFFATRRDPHKPPGTEVADFEEYTFLYKESWQDAEARWMMSTVATSMIFDDHDVRDDWNTSRPWRDRMAATTWWRDRIRGGLASYWIYQHLGNLSPKDLADDQFYAQVCDHGRDGDVLDLLNSFADKADAEVDGAKGTRWSYRRDFGRTRLLVIDSRCGRILDGARSMLSDGEFDWIERNCAGELDHLLIGTSLPWLMPPAISDLQSWNEVAADRPGPRGRLAERIRQILDFEHWPSFRRSFDRLAALVARTARGDGTTTGGPDGTGAVTPPATVCVLSGDVHHSYLAVADYPEPTAATVAQIACSPVHNHVPPPFRLAFRISWARWAGHLTRRLARRAGVSDPPLAWHRTGGPIFGNAVATLRLSGRRANLSIEKALPGEGHRLATVHDAPLVAG